jgi:hypothetical protein
MDGGEGMNAPKSTSGRYVNYQTQSSGDRLYHPPQSSARMDVRIIVPPEAVWVQVDVYDDASQELLTADRPVS